MPLRPRDWRLVFPSLSLALYAGFRFLVQGLNLLGWFPILVLVVLGPFLPRPIDVLHEVGGHPVHDLSKLEPQSDLEELVVLANGVCDAGFHAESTNTGVEENKSTRRTEERSKTFVEY